MKTSFCVGLLSSGFAVGLLLVPWGTVRAEEPIVHESLYNQILIVRGNPIVQMKFRRRGSLYMETAVNMDSPLDLVVPYTRTFFAAAIFDPDPKSALMIGLGGGAFNRLFNTAYPEAGLTTVELDEAVRDLAAEHMGFEAADNNVVIIKDGRLFVKRDDQQYDWILLDAFRGGYAPAHLKTVEFYQEIAARLAPGGVFLSNLHTSTALFDCDVVTLREVFPQVLFFEVTNSGNVVAVARNKAEPQLSTQLEAFTADEIPETLAQHLDFAAITAEVAPKVALDPAAKILTDDFAPVEFLNAMKRYNAPKY